jgi:hypothetical protein
LLYSLFIPRRSAYHTLENSQGTLDPLGLYTVADRLATKLAPGLRERMKHPRYLTAIAVSSVVCSSFDEEDLASDGISAPWQVFEWHVVSAFVKKFERGDPDKQLLGMPGREKTTTAFRDGLPLNAVRYLKTPSVFGFHGVYRTLAKNLNLIEGHQPGEFGIKLVDVWESEQNLRGFRVDAKGTPGGEFRSKLFDAVEKGMRAAAVSKPWAWEPYNLLAASLAPKSPGKNESDLLLTELRKGSEAVREELIDALISPEGQKLLNKGSEKQFHSWLINKMAGNLSLLKAIQAYERFCRLLYNAFYSILNYMERNSSKGLLADLAKIDEVIRAAKEIPIALDELENSLQDFPEEAILIQDGFSKFSERVKGSDWVRLLFEHHFTVQRNKQPSKASWVLEHGKDGYLLNTTQFLEDSFTEEYVHQYRTFTIGSFLKDLHHFD